MSLTQKQVIKAIRANGMTVRVTDGEYRVNYPGGAESTAYYTSDPNDAIMTANRMSRLGSYRKKNGRFGVFGA